MINTPNDKKKQEKGIFERIFNTLLSGIIKLVLTLTLCWYALGVDFDVNFSKKRSQDRAKSIGQKVVSTVKFVKNVAKAI